MLFDFAYFREQTCIVACPYGRLQSVLLDRQSLIVGYDVNRGEPRGKPKKKSLPVLESRGDCIDCSACVAVCPTGIDIRDGLQMECIGCAQCIDACDDVMDKVGKPRKLIGYTSQDVLAGKPRRVFRARTVIYPALLVVAASLLAWSASAGRELTKVWVERIQGPSFVELPDGRISSQTRIKIENESAEPRSYALSLLRAPDAQLRAGQLTWQLKGAQVGRDPAVRGRAARLVRARQAQGRDPGRRRQRVRAGARGHAARPRGSTAMSAASKWILAIVVLLGGNLIAMVVLAVVATSGGDPGDPRLLRAGGPLRSDDRRGGPQPRARVVGAGRAARGQRRGPRPRRDRRGDGRTRRSGSRATSARTRPSGSTSRWSRSAAVAIARRCRGCATVRTT